MSSSDHPDQEPTRRIDPSAPAGPPPGGDPTQRVGRPAAGAGDPTSPARQPWEGEAHPTEVSGRPWEGEAHAGPHQPEQDLDQQQPPRRRVGRGLVILLVGAAVGFVLAFVVVALGTDDTPVGELAAQDRIEELEAELGERDTRIADLEARLAEAEAAAGGREQDIEAQRQALDERAAVLDDWADELAAREAALQEREAAVAERERVVEDATEDDGPGIELPTIDDEAVEGIIERILEQIRDLFR